VERVRGEGEPEVRLPRYRQRQSGHHRVEFGRVAAEGTPFTVAGRTRTVVRVKDLEYSSGNVSNGCDGRACPLTPDGRVFFGLEFTDGTGGVYSATLPR
jgi:hypothetical protein